MINFYFNIRYLIFILRENVFKFKRTMPSGKKLPRQRLVQMKENKHKFKLEKQT